MKLPASIFGHQLMFPEGLSFTPVALRNALDLLKVAGYKGMIVVPKAWHSSLTAKFAVEIALAAGMKLQTCGFLPGNEFSISDHSNQSKSLAEIEKQMSYQLTFQDAGCGFDLFCGPIDNPWKSSEVFGFDKYIVWLDLLNTLAVNQKLRLAIEPLNATESTVTDAFQTLRKAIQQGSFNQIYFQYDTGHAHARGVSMEEFEAMIPQIAMFEFANEGRHPLEAKRGIDFLHYVSKLGLLPPNCLVSNEPFDPAGVILPLSLQNRCTTTTPGIEALDMDAQFLQKLKVMVRNR